MGVAACQEYCAHSLVMLRFTGRRSASRDVSSSLDGVATPGSDVFATKQALLRPQRVFNVQIVACFVKDKQKISRNVGKDPFSQSYYPISNKKVMVLCAQKCIIS